MIDSAALLAHARRQVNALVLDLRAHADRAVLDAEFGAARSAGRTSLPQTQWAEGEFAQVAVSWVLGCVFVRFCEDNRLVSDTLISGPGNRRDLAREHRAEYLRQNPSYDDRDWLRHIFTTYRGLPATGDIFGGHNPLWLLQPSADGARELVQAFQRIDPATGELSHDFTDPEWNTRFLGDLYQDLSDHAKKQFALLQTPVFVEEFILDHTLEPAIRTFGLKDADLIDPTCGSGHFLLGAFDRLFRHWRDAEPGTNPRELARRAVDAVAGVDINPYAVAIARFRLLLAALRAGGDRRLIDAPSYPINIAVGDSLLHTETQLTFTGIGIDDDVSAAAAHGYSTEDLEAARTLLSRQWTAVVGNPPYIVVRDPALNALYRKKYTTCRGKYSLGVPFTERFWQLARTSPDQPEQAGYIGMITANSFMKREMGKDLIEKWVPTHDITHLIDTSGAHIPGHGTPTVILFGRSRRPVEVSLRAVMGIRGEPSPPADPSSGLVWTSILEHLDKPGSQTAFVSVVDLERARLYSHPWSIGGGGASELKELLDRRGSKKLRAAADAIGPAAVPGTDDALIADRSDLRRRRVSYTREVVTGEAIRDYSIAGGPSSVFAYDSQLRAIKPEDLPIAEEQWLWPNRTTLASYVMFGRKKAERGLVWSEWGYVIPDRVGAPLLIAFASVATHNHFVLNRGGNAFKQSAPVIKLAAGATEQDHLNLLGPLNSSVGGFWLRQVMHDKGNRGEGGGITAEAWERFHDIDGTKLQEFPLPDTIDGSLATRLDRLASELATVSPTGVASLGTPTADRLSSARAVWDRLRSECIALQEQLDWAAYAWYGLADDSVQMATGEPPLALGERAFEIVLARKVAKGELETRWFERHGSVPRTELPAHWSTEYTAVVERRLKLIETDSDISLIERPEYKRRWSVIPWDEQQTVALRGWLLSRLESPSYWPAAFITSTAHLAALARVDADFMTVARLYSGRDDFDVAILVAELIKGESVPFLAALRYTDVGQRKWAEWCETWALQRRQDSGEDVGEIPVPPRYANSDFLGVTWTHRGKLDVPKERFISYPGAESDNDQSLVIGWAGWDHLERARALATFYLSAKREGRDLTFLTPLLAGLDELVPWLLQWHNEPNADPALDRPGSQIASLLDSELRSLHLTLSDLEGWRPAPTRRGRQRA